MTCKQLIPRNAIKTKNEKNLSLWTEEAVKREGEMKGDHANKNAFI